MYCAHAGDEIKNPEESPRGRFGHGLPSQGDRVLPVNRMAVLLHIDTVCYLNNFAGRLHCQPLESPRVVQDDKVEREYGEQHRVHTDAYTANYSDRADVE